MKILEVAPLFESVPPKLYGGTERIVSYLTEELVRLGHDVTLFASGDSVTKAKLIPQCKQSLRLNKIEEDYFAYYTLMIEHVIQVAKDFDVIHSHIDYMPFSSLRRLSTPSLTTLHGRLDIPDLINIYKEFKDIPLVSISDAQRKPIPWVNWQRTVYHGIPPGLYTFHENPKSYLAFLGRISPEKRVDDAIEIAKRVGMPLKIAAKIADVDQEYFATAIKPLLNSKSIEFLGEIPESKKNEFLGNAYALLFPIDWPEPFGVVMIEAMACGTPVIARISGSVNEIIEDGFNGFTVKNVQDAVRAVKRIPEIKRRRCRKIFETKFTSAHMATKYLEIFEKLNRKKETNGNPHG